MSSKDSKTNFALLRDKILEKNGKEYWRSVEEFVDAPEFADYVKYEHPEQADTWNDSLSRRNFVKVMGASLALAGLSGCVIQPSEKIVPYVSQPESIIPGKPLFFATAMTLGGIATGLLAKSNEGRPTKIEGNPEHPGSLGATDVLAQASLLNLYDPDRSKEVLYRAEPKTWQSFMTALRQKVDENRVDGGAGVRFLTETITSPTLQAQFEQVKKELPNSKWYQYEPINKDNATAGAKMAFGSAVNTVYKFDQADRVLTLDADIFSSFNVRYIKDFAKKRNFSEESKEINRLYAIETTMTLAGAKADHRLAVKPSQLGEVAKAIAAALGVSGAASTYKENAAWISALAKDLAAHKGKSIVIAGDNQPPMVHALAHAMNSTLGNVGTTVIYTDPLVANADTTQLEQLRSLIQEIDGGQVKMLVILGGNPVYNTPADLKLNKERMDKIPLRVHLGPYVDETGELCHWHVSDKHYLEMWSDARAFDGTVSIIQPLIDPLYDSHNAHEVVQLFFAENYDKKDYDIIREFWQKQTFNMTVKPIAATTENKESESKTEPKTEAKVETSPTPAAKTTPTPAPKTSPTPATQPTTTTTAATAPVAAKNFEDNWRKVVHDGFVPNSEAKPKTVSVNAAFLSQPQTSAANSGPLEISILPDPCVYDGRFTNNGWLQELPNPLNKITWENVALVSPKTAQRLGLNTNNDAEEFTGGSQGTSFINTRGGNQFSDLVKVKYQGGEITKPVPVWITPGQPDDVVTIFTGYGRTRAGRVGNDLGYNAYEVQKSDAMSFGTGDLSKTGETTTVASTQIHFNMEGRDILRVRNIDELEKYEKDDEQEDEYGKTMYRPEDFQKLYNENHRWGMTIDLNNCVGCNACVLACQSENNIPVVGKEQIERSREMHWMRIDAYFSGTVENPTGPNFQPLLCQQCEQAPCEVVCPVHATVHSAEGLNDMVYNRCIGTRYCSNNCPYKVRRFNFLLYQDWETPQLKLMRNPEVSIRSRGVMEKCTYCTQRIASARIEAEKDGRAIMDGEIVTACQAACPTDAIVFGNLNDKESKVAKLKEDHRNYKVLNELNTQPRTSYLAGLKNQNREMPDFKEYKPIDPRAKTEG
ncbi:MAG TPA: TAT-variant-translocated molybdopterin oxidoreductase [Pyrinomonadaceae bacterium]|jgi:molybdopterin-containing oxidoreductase family iron-sulfur binding subunit|nr:TAT-variant-translocated molybdopterin oxidoreductase [Pyrinomonadaceae bacterium]